MDLETENRIAAMLLKEAAELRRQADQEGVLAYLRKPCVRVRPNSRFLTTTVRGVEQANRAVEMNEMWRARQREIELDNRNKGRLSNGSGHQRHDSSHKCGNLPCSSSINRNDGCNGLGAEGLKDDEVEEFLRSRAKRGRGSIGSRMDEAGPYPSQALDLHADRVLSRHLDREEIRTRVVLGPKKSSWKSVESSEDEESEDDADRRKKSKKHRSKKHKSKDKKDKKKKHRHEKRHKQ